MTKNGRQAGAKDRGGPAPRRRLCAPVVPANIIGGALVFLFTYKVPDTDVGGLWRQ